ncbi:MAG: hypothetical protein ACE5FG_06810 [Myxococcota bacterium]
MRRSRGPQSRRRTAALLGLALGVLPTRGVAADPYDAELSELHAPGELAAGDDLGLVIFRRGVRAEPVPFLWEPPLRSAKLEPALTHPGVYPGRATPRDELD